MELGGHCDSHRLIETAEDCAAAAVEMGLSSTTPTEINNVIRLKGCYYHMFDRRLYFNVGGVRRLADISRFALCSECLKCPPSRRSDSDDLNAPAH